MLVRVLIVVDKEETQDRLMHLFERTDVLVTILPSDSQTMEQISRENSDLIIISRSLLPEHAGTSISMLRKLPDRPEVLVIREVEDSLERQQLLAGGACAVANTDLSDETLGSLLKIVIERRVEGMLARLGAERSARKVKFADFVSASPAMNSFMETVYRIVDTDTTLLILGETGVGKEHLARAIHVESRRSKGAFISLNCGALPDTLLESELFGHEQGAFTGAVRSLRGQFELAHRGTIFLDEIAEMPQHLQVKLLQVLERRQIRRLGGERLIDVDVRVMAATNRNLAEDLANGRFRLDLYYRLGALTLTIPPLRERREDIPELVENYLGYFSINTGKLGMSIAPQAIEAMMNYSWPGNVRELINVIERAVLLCNGNIITLADLPSEVRGMPPSEMNHVDITLAPSTTNNFLKQDWYTKPLREARRDMIMYFENEYLRNLLRETRGRVGEAAHRAGVSPRALFELLRRQGIRKEDFRAVRRS